MTNPPAEVGAEGNPTGEVAVAILGKKEELLRERSYSARGRARHEPRARPADVVPFGIGEHVAKQRGTLRRY
jgi:hypothetical protein